MSAQLTIVIAAIFASTCFGVAIKGFSAIADMTDAVQIADAKGFAMYWAFLGIVATVVAALSVWVIRSQKAGADD